MVNFSDPNYVVDPRSRSYHAYREWQRLSAVKDAGSMCVRAGSTKRDNDEEWIFFRSVINLVLFYTTLFKRINIDV